MKPIPRKAAAAPKTGRGPATVLAFHGPKLNLLRTREPGYEFARAYDATRREG